MREVPIDMAHAVPIAPPSVVGDTHRFSPFQVETLLAAAIELGAVAAGIVDAPALSDKIAAALLEQSSIDMRRALAAMGYALPEGLVQ
jgi:hypothetical protein